MRRTDSGVLPGSCPERDRESPRGEPALRVHPSLRRAAVLLLAALFAGPALARGTPTDRALLDRVGYEQRIGESLPADTWFVDATGQRLTITSLAAERPLVLIMAWLDCPNLCPLVLAGTARAEAALPLPSERYRVAVVGIDPDAGAADAREKRARLRERFGETLDNWRFLAGDRAAIERLARAVGFHYAYDPATGRYAHPAGLVIVAPGGRINRYLFSLRPDPDTLELALIEASRGQLGSIADRIFLRCFRFDPESGKYTLAIVKVMRWTGSGFALALIGAVVWLRRRERS